MSFGKKVTALRKEKKLSQQELATKVGTHLSVLAKYERDDVKPSIENAKKIADFFDVTLDYLVSDNEKIVKDKALLNKIYTIDSFTNKEKDYIFFTLDAFN